MLQMRRSIQLGTPSQFAKRESKKKSMQKFPIQNPLLLHFYTSITHRSLEAFSHFSPKKQDPTEENLLTRRSESQFATSLPSWKKRDRVGSDPVPGVQEVWTGHDSGPRSKVRSLTVNDMETTVASKGLEEDSWYWDSNDWNSSLDNTNSSNPEVHLVVPNVNPASALLVIILSGLIFVTMIGNILVCLAVVLVRKLRRPQNYLLMSLATSDLLVAVTVMPFAIINEIYGNQWPFSSTLCSMWVSADVLCCTASILNLCGISVDRYQAITSPLNYSVKASPKRMLSIVLSVWLGSACVSLPPLLLLGNEHLDPNDPTIQICTVSQNFWYQIYATMVSFYVPLVVMVVLYLKILRVVGDKKKGMNWKPVPLQHQTSTQSLSVKVKTIVSIDGRMKTRTFVAQDSFQDFDLSPSKSLSFKKEKAGLSLRDHKASATLGIIMTAFTVCWLPFFVLALVKPFATIYHFQIPTWVSSLFLWLGYTNSALNPVIYATLNRDFRRPFKEILCLRCSTLETLMRQDFYNHQFGRDSDARRTQRQQLFQETQLGPSHLNHHPMNGVDV